MIKMDHNIWSVPRRAFTWLDNNFVIVTSENDEEDEIPCGHCLALNTVRPQNSIDLGPV